jgi:hypothetical protein
MKTRDVPAFEALRWVKAAWQILSGNLAGWMGMMGAWLGITLLLALIPFVNNLALALVTPILVGGMMIACRDQLAGKPISPAHLFLAFKTNGRALMAVGSITFLCELAIASGMHAAGVPPPTNWETQAQLLGYVAQLKPHEGTLWLAMGILIVVKILLWFTIPLLALHSMPLSHALRWSLFAGFSNIGAALVFCALMVVAAFAILFTLGLGFFVVVPLFFICSYTSYVSVFDLNDDTNKNGTAAAVPPEPPTN